MRLGDLVDAGVAEITTGPFGTQLKASSYVEQGRPVLNVRNIGFGDVRSGQFEFVDEDTAARLSRHVLMEEDIVFGRKGAVERHAFIREPYVGALQGSDCIRLRLSSNAPLVARFATYALRTPWHLEWMQRHCSHGATMASLNQDILRLVEFPDMERRDQERVADVLWSFDDLIENGQRRIEILDETARSLYRDWFVRLRFPGHDSCEYVESDFGLIPKSWAVTPLGNALDFVMGQSPPSAFYNDEGKGLPFHQGVGSYGRRYPRLERWTTQWSRQAGEGDVLISVRAPVGRLNIADKQLALGRGLAAVRPVDGLSFYWFEALRHIFRNEDSFGGGTIFKAVTRGDLLGIAHVMPDEPLRRAFDDLVRPVAELDLWLDQQGRVLRAARDLLLSKLVTGTIEVDSLGVDDVFGWSELAAKAVVP